MNEDRKRKLVSFCQRRKIYRRDKGSSVTLRETRNAEGF